jgi:hypothetical protein
MKTIKVEIRLLHATKPFSPKDMIRSDQTPAQHPEETFLPSPNRNKLAIFILGPT